MDLLLRCNNHMGGYCRNELRNEAYVTTCSHIFCKDCVQKYAFQDTASGRRECLACGTGLPSAADVVLANLRPKDEYQCTILAGLDPNTIIECTGKALRFWNYQTSTEIAWQEHLGKEMTTRYSALNNNARKVIDDANTEIAELQKQLEAVQIEKRGAEKRTEEMANMYKEKSKRCQTMSDLYDALKKRVQDEQTRGAAVASAEHTLQSMGAIPKPETFTSSHHRMTNFHDMANMKKTPHQHRFSIDQHGVEQLHPYQRSGSAPRAQTSSEIAATAHANHMMLPPARPVVNGPNGTHRISTSSTPARRVSLGHGRTSGSHTVPQMAIHQPGTLQQYAVHSADQHTLGSERPRYQSQAYAGHGMSPNIHSRMPANRDLY